MGMFDYIRCEYPLPDYPIEDHDFAFQTKDLDNALRDYFISKEGKLYLDGEDIEPENFSGDIDFYHSNACGAHSGMCFTRNGEDHFWLEYKAVFVKGSLVHVERTKYTTEPAGHMKDFWKDTKPLKVVNPDSGYCPKCGNSIPECKCEKKND